MVRRLDQVIASLVAEEKRHRLTVRGRVGVSGRGVETCTDCAGETAGRKSLPGATADCDCVTQQG